MEKGMPEIKIDIDRYRAKEGDKINLKKIATACDIDIDKEAVKTAAFPEALEEINLLQAKLYAQSTYGLIIVLQAMDAQARTGRSSMSSHIWIRMASMSFPSSSRTVKKRTTTTCGVSIARCRAAGISASSTVPTMRMSS